MSEDPNSGLKTCAWFLALCAAGVAAGLLVCVLGGCQTPPPPTPDQLEFPPVKYSQR